MKPSVARPGATASGSCEILRASSKTIGAAELVKALFFRRAQLGIAADHLEIARHQCEGLGITLLALAQSRHGFRIGGVASQMIAAKAFDRDDMAFEQKAGHGIDIVEHAESREFDGAAAGFFERHARPAAGAGNRLRMEAPVSSATQIRRGRHRRVRNWPWSCGPGHRAPRR